ncbi:nuclear RNA export factor 1-like [Macrobrachium nipponense]|uniref:nuclear RNA export factor 1-like n=1 Tax=Macrobrachium nipponense TaxID=159736 RepID=UPI0030C8BC3C
MGRKSKRKNKDRQQKLDKMFPLEDMNLDDNVEVRRGAKEQSKLSKKERKKRLRQMMQMSNKSNQNAGSSCAWHKITVKGDNPLDKEFVLSSIANIVDIQFSPLGFCRIDNSSVFYLENNEQAASAIAGLDKRLQGPDGCRLKIASNKCEGPDLVLNAHQLQILQQCLSRRYNNGAFLLDLSDLHNDPLLKEKDILTPLQTPMVMKQVLKLVKENIPELRALNLSHNGLRRNHLQNLQALQSGCSQLAALNLEQNNICDLKVLNSIKVFPITELNLQFNPIVETFKDRPLAYIKEVRSRLANLKVLDSIDIETYLAENDKPSPYKMNVNFSKNEKIMCGSSSSNSEFEVTDSTVRMFLDQYYKLIDTAERVSLVVAYTPDAVLEVKSNLELVHNGVFVGHEKIREALLMVPATQHNHSSFSLHVQPLGPKSTRAEVTGQCQVAGVGGTVAFLRIMNIVPFNVGFCCSQDKWELKLTGT